VWQVEQRGGEPNHQKTLSSPVSFISAAAARVQLRHHIVSWLAEGEHHLGKLLALPPLLLLPLSFMMFS
jgi:hypothetical protein